MTKSQLLALSTALVALFPSAATAGEAFGGLYKHGVDTPLTLGGSPESGVDVQLGYRTAPVILGTGLAPYAFGAVNSKGDTSYAAAGLAWKFGDRLFVRPGIGIAIHNGSAGNFNRTDRIAFGSRVLFEPELGIGVQINGRMTIEASWVHLSHATLFGGQNPGIDNIGARFGLKL
jgi:hypothetical protein